MDSFARLAVPLLLGLLRIASTQNYGDLRLVQGNRTSSSFSAGRLEIFINSTWGSVCADNFSMTEANVACRQLGYQGAVSTDTSFHTPFGRGRHGPVWLDEVDCSEELLHLLSCANDGLGDHDCDHFSDVAVVCIDQPRLTAPNPMDIRLSGAEYPSEGRIEVHCGGQWAAVCNQVDFSQVKADAVCRQLGYTEATDFDADVTTEALQLPQWLGQLSCPNETNSIASCGECSEEDIVLSHDSLEACSSVTVRCTHTVSYGSLRLVQGADEISDVSHGRLEIFQRGVWGTVCSDTFTQFDAGICCQQLGFLRALRFQDSLELELELDSISVPLTSFECAQDERRLIQCSQVPAGDNCTHDQDVALFCTHSPPFTAPPGTPPPDEGAKLPTSTLIGILVGCSLVLLLSCVCFAICSAHFYLVPYSLKKERHNLYFIEREASAERDREAAETETDVDQKLSDLESQGLGLDGAKKARKNRYVSLDTPRPILTEDSSSAQQAAELPYQGASSSVPQPVEDSTQQISSLPIVDSLSRVSVHSLHVLPGTPQVQSHHHHHQQQQQEQQPTTPPAKPKRSPNLRQPFQPLQSSQSQPNIATPVPTSIPVPPPVVRQMEKNRAKREAIDEPEATRSLVNSSFMSESDPMLQTQDRHGSVPVQSGDSDQTTPNSQHTTPTRSIMKSPKGRAKAAVSSMPHLAHVHSDERAADREWACDPALSTDVHNHRVSFRLD